MHRSPRPSRGRRALPVAVLAAVLLALTSCGATSGGGQPSGVDDGQAPVAVATTTQLGSVLEDITSCAGTSSVTLMGPGDDPHDYSPSSRQVAQLARAGLVVANGLGLEAGMQSALDNARTDGARLLEVGPELDPLPSGGEDHGHTPDDGHGHDHGEFDPHVWMDASRMATAAGVIGAALAEQTGDQDYARCGEEVAAGLEDTDRQVREILSAVPPQSRTLVTDHAAYAYFAEAYGFEVAGVVVPGGSTDAEPSSERLAELVAGMEHDGADALVMSAGSGNRLVQALSAETGGAVPVVELYEGGVGPEGSGAETYHDAMLASARALADALS